MKQRNVINSRFVRDVDTFLEERKSKDERRKNCEMSRLYQVFNVDRRSGNDRRCYQA